MLVLKWKDFDSCINVVSNKYRDKSLKGVYGIPRGGLCIAVAISHALEIPLLNKPIPPPKTSQRLFTSKIVFFSMCKHEYYFKIL